MDSRFENEGMFYVNVMDSMKEEGWRVSGGTGSG